MRLDKKNADFLTFSIGANPSRGVLSSGSSTSTEEDFAGAVSLVMMDVDRGPRCVVVSGFQADCYNHLEHHIYLRSRVASCSYSMAYVLVWRRADSAARNPALVSAIQ